MKEQDFINIARKIAYETPTKYKRGGVGQHEDKYFLFDCIGLIKSILWGFNFDYSKYRGGAVYKSNGVPDYGANTFFKECCYNKSSDFTNVEEGELVWLDGHIGIYEGNRKVIESTTAWESKVLVSNIGNNGERTKNGRQIYKWTYHAKCKFIEYEEPIPPTPPTPEEPLKQGDKVKIIGEGRASSYGDLPVAKGIGWERTILKIYEGRPYPYRVGNEYGTTGFYTKESLEKL